MNCGCHEHDDCKECCHEHEEEVEDLLFPRTNIYRCFNPCTGESNCILCD